MKTLLAFAWVAVFSLFVFGVWAVSEPGRAPLTMRYRLGPVEGPVFTVPSTMPTLPPPAVVVPQVRTVTVTVPPEPPQPTTTTTVPPVASVCLDYLTDRCLVLG